MDGATCEATTTVICSLFSLLLMQLDAPSFPWCFLVRVSRLKPWLLQAGCIAKDTLPAHVHIQRPSGKGGRPLGSPRGRQVIVHVSAVEGLVSEGNVPTRSPVCVAQAASCLLTSAAWLLRRLCSRAWHRVAGSPKETMVPAHVVTSLLSEPGRASCRCMPPRS